MDDRHRNRFPSGVPDLAPILSCPVARAWEERWFAGDADREWAAMVRAGRAVARLGRSVTEEAGPLGSRPRLLVLAGPGHNGGDALLAASSWLEAVGGGDVAVLWTASERGAKPLTKRAAERLAEVARRLQAGWAEAVWEAKAPPAWLEEPWDVVLDGVHGQGFRRPLAGPVRELFRHLAQAGRTGWRLAVDLPSGLGDEGPDPDAFRADLTVATGWVKRAVLAPEAAPWVGRLVWADLGFAAAAGGPEIPLDRGHPHGDGVLTGRVLEALRRPRAPRADKRHHGHVFILAGSRRFPGAALLAVRAALHSGAGLVTAAVPDSVHAAFAAAEPAAMWVPWPEEPGGGLALEGLSEWRARADRIDALLLGPGLGAGAETAALVEALIGEAGARPLVLDADALQPAVWRAVRRGGCRAVLTPHDGEWARLVGARDAATAEAQWERWCRHEAGDHPGLVVVRKGAPTRLASTAGVAVSLSGGPVLARGGSGDVLAGLAAGLAAGAARAGAFDGATSAAQAVAWHGAAADVLAVERGVRAVTASDLIAALGPALRRGSEAAGRSSL